MPTSPTQRSLALLRKEGYKVAVAEKFNSFIKIRQDLFGWIDLVAMHPETKTLVAIQTTSGSNLAARITKAKALDTLKLWLECGSKAEFHGWKKAGARGKRKLWTVDRRSVLLEDVG